ncbi:MAG TPA: helix-turn-helix transcriptional regulator [Burkholderiaceae bacterium]
MHSPLRKIRLWRGLSLHAVALAVGSDTGNLSRIETGEQVAKKQLAAKLAAYFAPHIDERHVIYPERYGDWAVPGHIAPAAD